MCSTLGAVYEQYKNWCPQIGGLMCKYFLILMCRPRARGGGLGSRPKKMYGERLGDGVEYHLMKPTPRR